MNFRILDHLDDIDVRRELGVSPRRLVVNNNTRFVPKRSEYVYDKKTQTMFDFSGMKEEDHPYWVIRRGIPFSQFRSPNTYVFNMGWEDYDMTMFTHNCQLGPTVCRNHIVVRDSIKFVNTL